MDDDQNGDGDDDGEDDSDDDDGCKHMMAMAWVAAQLMCWLVFIFSGPVRPSASSVLSLCCLSLSFLSCLIFIFPEIINCGTPHFLIASHFAFDAKERSSFSLSNSKPACTEGQVR